MPSSLDRFLDRALKIRVGEGPKVGLMALYAANAIGAVVVGRTVRDALFLADRSKDALPMMYIFNSIAVALLSWGYARIADRMRRDRLNAFVAVGWAAVMAMFFAAALTNSRATAPILYVAVEAMGSLVVIQFWTFAQDIFTSREAKRLFPLISAGGQAANVVYGFLASTVSKHFGAETLLLLCAANLVACAFLAWYISKRFGVVAPMPVTRPRAKTQERQQGASNGVRVLATRHLLSIAAIAVVSALVVNLVDFQFKAAAELQFVDNKRELGAFFGKFYGICGAVALALQMGVTGRFLERFGILASLLPLPIGLFTGSAVAWWSPSGWTASLAKGSDSIFRYTLNDASMQLLYVPVPQHQRGRAKALIDGILRPMAGIAAGLLLVMLGRHGFGTGPDHAPDAWTTGIILVLAVGWVILLFRAKDEYVRSLLDTLQRRKLDLNSTPINADQATADALAKVLHSNDALAILHAIELLPNVRGRDFGPQIAELLDHPVSSVRAAAADHLADHPDKRYAEKLRLRLTDRDPWCVASAIGAICALEKEKALPQIKPFLQDLRPAIRAAAVVGLVRHAGINGILEAADELKRQLNAQTTVERELAASLLGELGVPTFYDALIRFLQDPSPNVRRAALIAAGRLKSPELVPYIIAHLARRETAQDASKALVAYGPGVEQALGLTLKDKTVPPEVRYGTPVVLGRIGTKNAADILQEALELNDPPVRAAAARALARLMRKLADIVIRRDVIIKAVNLEIDFGERLADAQGALDLPVVDRNATTITRDQGARMMLALALMEERDRAIQRAIVLLELLYPNAGLDVAADNLRSDTAARRANAVEVFDNTVKEECKKRLLYLLEDRLSRSIPSGRTRAEWLSELITGPNAWVTACSAQVALELKETGVVAALQHGLSSPVAYVREACANALWKLAPAEAHKYVAPLKDDSAKGVRRLVQAVLDRLQLATA